MKYCLFSLLALFMFTSCTERISIDTDNSDPVIVIYGDINTWQPYPCVRVSASAGYFDKPGNTGIPDAVVSIVSGENKWEMEPDASNLGYYSCTENLRGTPGSSYKLEVKYDFDRDGIPEVYEASTVVPEPFTVDSIGISKLRMMKRTYYSLKIYAQDLPGPDYYLFKIYVNGALVTRELHNFQVASDDLFDGDYIDGMVIHYLVDEEYKDDYDEDEQDGMIFVSQGDRIVVDISRIDKGYFDFIVQAQDQLRGSNPMFGSPPANIHTNISGGGVGFFGSFNPAKRGVIVPE